MLKNLRWRSIIRCLKEHDCHHLAAKLSGRRGIGLLTGVRSTLNGHARRRTYQQVVEGLVRSGLQGNGFESVRRTVDYKFREVQADIDSAERDILAHLLYDGILQKK